MENSTPPAPSPQLNNGDPTSFSLFDLTQNNLEEDFVDYLDSLDWTSGETKHLQQYSAFLRAWSLGIKPETAFKTVVDYIEKNGGVLLPDQVRRQQQRAYEYVTGQIQDGCAIAIVGVRKPKPTFSPEILKTVASKVMLTDIWAFIKSRSVVAPETVTRQGFLLQLYQPGEKILVFTVFESQGQVVFNVDLGLEQAIPEGGVNGVWFLSNPVDGCFHPNPRERGKLSRRSQESVTSWRYMVLESDQADANDWLRAIAQLPLRIVAIYTSGGRSIHCLVRLDAASKAEWDGKKDEMKSVLVTLGADQGALTAVRLTRLPQCWRGPRRQELLYLNPTADGTPIMSLPLRLDQDPGVGNVTQRGGPHA